MVRNMHISDENQLQKFHLYTAGSLNSIHT